MRRYLFSFLFLFSLKSFSQTEKCDIVFEFKRRETIIIKDTQNIPYLIKDVFVKRFEKPFFMANPDELYNFSDMVSEGLPNERLVFAGHDRNKQIFFLYFQAGIELGLGNILLIIKRTEKSFVVLQNTTFPSTLRKNINVLKRRLNCKNNELFIIQ